jgi:hypothetical protein
MMKALMNRVATALVLAGVMAVASPALRAAPSDQAIENRAPVVTLCMYIQESDPVQFSKLFGTALADCVTTIVVSVQQGCAMLQVTGELEKYYGEGANVSDCVADLTGD